MYKKLFFISLMLVSIFNSCLTIEHKFDKMPPGIWRASLRLEGKELRPTTDRKSVEMAVENSFDEGELPFIFELKYDENENMYFVLKNGEESLATEIVQFGRMKNRVIDTFRVDFPVFDTYISGTFKERQMKGNWVVNYRKNYQIPFEANYGRNYRFTQLNKPPEGDLNGKWKVIFSPDNDPFDAIAEFEQKGNHLSGTFLTETGDYRFLEGTLQGNKFYLSAFDGAHAFLFEGKILENGSLIGSFMSGSHYKTTWSAVRNPNFQLKNAEELTYLKEGFDAIDFSFQNSEGEMISINQPSFEGKVKIVQILGTWCPNCMDETQFLVEYLKTNPSKNLEVIGLAFEKYEQPERVFKLITNLKQKFKVPYEILWAGSSSKDKAAEALPMLNAIISYPTMILIDKNNKVRKIHTGFSGPATSEFESFKSEFDSFVKQLLNE